MLSFTFQQVHPECLNLDAHTLSAVATELHPTTKAICVCAECHAKLIAGIYYTASVLHVSIVDW